MASKLNSIVAWFQADPRRLIIIVMLVMAVFAIVALVAPGSVAFADGSGGGLCCSVVHIP